VTQFIAGLIVAHSLPAKNILNKNMHTLPIVWDSGSRWSIIEKCLESTHHRSYLEIGCDQDDVFSRVEVQTKVGVDPISGGTHRMTSDEFFSANQDRFDVIYIDGLHHYDQATRDIANALDCLTDQGFIVIHDMLPDHEAQTRVPRPDHWGGSWTGDVWRCGFDLMKRRDLRFAICTIDCGCGILFPAHQDPVEIPTENSWSWYASNWHRLPLINLHWAQVLIHRRR